MKILYVHNEYAKPSGEEHASGELVSLLREHGHDVRWFTRSSAEITGSVTGKIKALAAGVWNPSSARRLEKVLDDFKPDIVQVQNLYPLLSTSIFTPIKKRGIPVVMRCPNYRLFCPNGLCLDNDGNVCEKCFTGTRELMCVAKNCERSLTKSLGYALRNSFARITRRIVDNVDVFIVQSEFQKKKFVSQGIPAHKIGILPGIVPNVGLTGEDGQIGEYVSFVGRVSREKGIDEFIAAARRCPGIPFKVAGNIDDSYAVPDDLPANIEFAGFLKGEDLDRLYINSRIIVVPSKWYEGFPNVIVRGMLHNRPVITSDIGAMQSIIDSGSNGILVAPGDAAGLADAIARLWQDKDLCIEYGRNGREKARKYYSREMIYDTLADIFALAQINNQSKF